MDPPDVSETGLQLSEEIAIVGRTCSETLCEPPFKVAWRATDKPTRSGPTVAVKPAEVTPAGTVTLGGTDTMTLPDERLTLAPPEPAG